MKYQRKKQNNRSKGIVYSLWNSIKARCYNSKAVNYLYYGAKGIKICDEWLDYFVFEKWCMDNNYNKSMSIEREDNNLDYSPDNCKLIPKTEQPINRGKNLITKPYRAEITVNKKTIIIGYYETEDLAIEARKEYIKNNPPTK